MKATLVKHKGVNRIKVEFPYNEETIMNLRQIEDCRWSMTLRAWHIPHSRDAVEKLKGIFPEIEYPSKVIFDSTVEKQQTIIISQEPLPVSSRQDITIHVLGHKILIRMPKIEVDILFIKSIRFSKWDKNNYCWNIPNYPGNIDLIKEYFDQRIASLTINETIDYQIKDVSKSISAGEILLIRTASGSLRLLGVYKKEIIEALKNIPFKKWDQVNKWWSFPYTGPNVEIIRSVCKDAGLKFRYEEAEKAEKGKPRLSQFDLPNYRECPGDYILKLKELRYSESTIRTYADLFQEFINYHFRYDIRDIDEPTIIAYIRYLVMERKVSTSYQNQAINAIKFYYEKVLGGQRKFYFIERPIREKTLPVVLSEEEIKQIFSNIRNIKHKAILMIGYSAGLRVSEIVNLKVNDIDSDRMQIRISQSKGKKDRYTILAIKTLDILRQYFEVYHPNDWLFEGLKGQKYSTRSVQEILKNAAKLAGIRKMITVHTLRHSFATHLLEHGTDIRYIQTLLGHQTVHTTEIYTHISTKYIGQIKSPVDNLDL